jgi:hypothetical protein
MIAKDVLGYQFGNADSIRRVAGSKHLIWISALLVLITSIPRNYDQTYIGEAPWWPVIPLLFSFFSGTFLFLILQLAFIRQAVEGFWQKYALFLGLFWMTAPVAWLYGIPFERWLDPRAATIGNLWLLGIVSAWRVVLIIRVVAVVFQVHWTRPAGWVLFAASTEVLVVLFSRVLGEGIARGMGGMRNSPEQELIVDVLGKVFITCLFAAPGFLFLMLVTWKLFSEKARLIELCNDLRVPKKLLILAPLVWFGIAVQPQSELAKEFHYRRHLRQEKFREALAYLNKLEPDDWPPAKSFRPDPYEAEVWNWLPGLMLEVTANEKHWVQQRLLWVFERTFEHGLARFDEKQYLEILRGIERFEGGEKWITGSEKLWTQLRDLEDFPELVKYLEEKGIDIVDDQPAE